MTAPTPTTSTSTSTRRNGTEKTVKVTEWKVEGYTLRHADHGTLSTWIVNTDDFHAPGVHQTGDYLNGPAEFGVNWSSQGTMSPEETEAYAEQMMHAASVAALFTKIAAEFTARNK